MISLIIPTLNEEKYLPLLLKSIRKQEFFDYELILADAGSKDKTLDIAEKFGCRIIAGGLPAKGRNEGAKIAKGNILFFLDADTILPDKFFDKAVAEFKKRNLELASFRLIPLPPNRVLTFLMNIFYNFPAIFLENILPHAATGIFVEKDLFVKIGGFDEDVKLAEDHYMVRQAKKFFNARIGMIKSTEIFVSDRRFKTDGWIVIAIKYFLCELHLIFLGPVRSDIFKYRFNHYSRQKKEINK